MLSACDAARLRLAGPRLVQHSAPLAAAAPLPRLRRTSALRVEARAVANEGRAVSRSKVRRRRFHATLQTDMPAARCCSALWLNQRAPWPPPQAGSAFYTVQPDGSDAWRLDEAIATLRRCAPCEGATAPPALSLR